ncbi:MAG: efflux RND transporter periplasmic adaptor subunit [Gammaproteobacteria bacterium]|nr:efflux RND transporter periplasmic adaptor subunit [Gammaproteobacteria bacterium]
MKITIILLSLLLSLGSARLAAEPLVNITAEQRQAIGIETAALQPIEYNRSALLPARVTVPNAQLQVVTAPQSGLVETLLVSAGEAVQAGQTLLRIQSPALLELESDYLENRTRLTLARRNYERDRQLYQEGIIAERRMLESQASYQELATTVARLKRLLELAGLEGEALRVLEQLRQLTGTLLVRAPFDGVVLEQMVTPGTRVAAADALYRVASLKPLWLEIHMPLEQLGTTAVGQQVLVQNDPPLRGEVINIGHMVHGADQGVLIRAEVGTGSELLRPGQFVQVQIAMPAAADRYRIPREALIRSAGKHYVFVSRPDGFVPVAVTVIMEEPEHLVIQTVLATDSQIAVRGVATLKAAWSGGTE